MNLFNGNCIEIMDLFLGDNSIDAVVTDPPYGLKFMGKKWDYDVPSIDVWREILRILKPGGHVLSFGGTRTYHRMVVNIEDAGFEIRDQIQWLYGSGFPKSHNISKGIDKKFGLVTSEKRFNVAGQGIGLNPNKELRSDHPNYIKPKGKSDLAKQWDGFGTALKPANEPICLARKPLSEKTIVDNVLKWGVGGINIDGCRVNVGPEGLTKGGCKVGREGVGFGYKNIGAIEHAQGRFPANILLDETAAAMLDEQSGNIRSRHGTKQQGQTGGGTGNLYKMEKCSIDKSRKVVDPTQNGYLGGASRFFYCAKSSKSERGLDNNHPTVKPIKLMQYLVRLVTPPNGIVLDPFMGSGTTGIACIREGFDFIGIELNKEYFEIAKKRLKK